MRTDRHAKCSFSLTAKMSLGLVICPSQEFGNCPHYLCRGQSVVPLGVRDEPHIETVKLYCPKCQDVYVHPSHAAQSECSRLFLG